ncbi:hypothetical protein ACFQ4C_30460 [Larkinella insperata]|uniref:Lipoprotein n=1 Tax=Larkinella insperata TaxID=332158 RepID=A0ABW3QLR8_9BACT
MKNRFTSLILLASLFLLLDACKDQTVSSSVFNLKVKQCNQPRLAYWPRDLSVSEVLPYSTAGFSYLRLQCPTC